MNVLLGTFKYTLQSAHLNLNFFFSCLHHYGFFKFSISHVFVASMNLPDWSGLKAFLLEVKAENACFQQLNANVLCLLFLFLFLVFKKNFYHIAQRFCKKKKKKTEQPLF